MIYAIYEVLMGQKWSNLSSRPPNYGLSQAKTVNIRQKSSVEDLLTVEMGK